MNVSTDTTTDNVIAVLLLPLHDYLFIYLLTLYYSVFDLFLVTS